MKMNESVNCKMSDKEMLEYAREHDMINLSRLRDDVDMSKRKELLAMHPYAITRTKEGKYRTYFPDKKKGRVLKERSTKTDIEDLIVDYWKEQTNNPTIAEVFVEWNNRRRDLKKISLPTWERNEQTFRRFYGNEEQFGQKRIKDVSPEDYEDFLEEQVPKFHLKAKAYAGLVGITRGFLKRAKKRGLIDFNVEEMLNDTDVSRDDYDHSTKEDSEEVFNETETPIILNYLSQHLDNDTDICLLLMFITGLRVGEAATLKHSDIDRNSVHVQRTETRIKDENGKYHYLVKESPKTKAGIRTIVVPSGYEWLLWRLKNLNPDGEWIFTKRNGGRLTASAIRSHLYRVCDKLGIPRKSPHKIRKTYCSILLDAGVDTRMVTDQMGHTNISCSEHNYHRTRRTVEHKQKILDSISDLKAANA